MANKDLKLNVRLDRIVDDRVGKKEPSLEEMLRRWRANLHALDIKLTRLENDRKTKTLPVRLSPGALQHVEVF